MAQTYTTVSPTVSIVGGPRECKNGGSRTIRVLWLPDYDRYLTIEEPEDLNTSRFVRHICPKWTAEKHPEVAPHRKQGQR